MGRFDTAFSVDTGNLLIIDRVSSQRASDTELFVFLPKQTFNKQLNNLYAEMSSRPREAFTIGYVYIFVTKA